MARAVPDAAGAGAISGSPAVRVSLLIGASVTFAVAMSVFAHEVGHWTATRWSGTGASITVRPLGESFTTTVAAVAPGWPDAAGPLMAVGLGALVFVVVWWVRRPALLPLLVWGPVAALLEGVTMIAQVVGDEPGTDHVRLMVAGVPGWSIVAFGVVAVGAGMAGLAGSLPNAGPTTGGITRRTAVIAAGFGVYPLACIVTGLSGGPGSVGRGVRFLVLGAVTALVLGVVGSGRACRRPVVSSRAVAAAVLAAVGAVVAPSVLTG